MFPEAAFRRSVSATFAENDRSTKNEIATNGVLNHVTGNSCLQPQTSERRRRHATASQAIKWDDGDRHSVSAASAGGDRADGGGSLQICTSHHGSSVTFCNAGMIVDTGASGSGGGLKSPPSPVRRSGSSQMFVDRTDADESTAAASGQMQRSSSMTLAYPTPAEFNMASVPSSPAMANCRNADSVSGSVPPTITTCDGNVSQPMPQPQQQQQPSLSFVGDSPAHHGERPVGMNSRTMKGVFRGTTPTITSTVRGPGTSGCAQSAAALLLAPPPLGLAPPSLLSPAGIGAGSITPGGCSRSGGSKTVLVTPYGSFLSVNQSPAEFRESTISIGDRSSIAYNIYGGADEGEEMSLVYTRIEKIPMKDFAAEIRAHLDVEHFLSQAQLMLDWPVDCSAEQVLDTMLHHLLDVEETAAAYHDASKVLFTHKSVRQLSKTIQSTCSSNGATYDYDQSWVCVLCTAASVQKRHVAIARLRSPAYIGRTCQEVWFIILVVTSTKEKGTKNALETGRTFATLFADTDLRVRLLGARSEAEFKRLMWEQMKELADEQQVSSIGRRKGSESSSEEKEDDPSPTPEPERCWFARGLRADWMRRMPHYLSDYKDGFVGPNTLNKTLSTTFFLYFACSLPAIALGVLNYNNTGGQIDVKKTIYSQTISGLVFAVLGGQPMVILLTTAPLALYTKVINNICEEWGLDFLSMFACTGLWSSFFLLIYAFTDASNMMKWCTRSTEEIFALFISIAFAVDAFRDVACDFHVNYNSPNCRSGSMASLTSGRPNMTSPLAMTTPMWYDANATLSASDSVTIAVSSAFDNRSTMAGATIAGQKTAAAVNSKYAVCSVVSSLTNGECRRENSLLYLLLMLGTVWLGLSLYNFTKTPFLNQSKRELLADCALPVSVLTMSFFGSYVFKDINLTKFKIFHGDIFIPAPLASLQWTAILGAMGLGFCLSLLIFMDQNIAGAMVNSPDNRLKKGPAHHWDLMVVAILNAVLAVFGLPLVHGALPHSPLHVRAMADVEDRVCQGHIYFKIVSVRETRVTGILSHVLIGLSVLFIDQLKLIPRPVLDGLFLYLAVTAVHGNQLFERIMLLVTEQTAYPPNHYIRTVPQRKIHLFTFIQLLQLAVLCGFGFAPIPYLKMVFPVLHIVMLPIRHKLVPRVVEKKYLHSLDGH